MSCLLKSLGMSPLMILHKAHLKCMSVTTRRSAIGQKKAEVTFLKLFSYEHKHKSGEFWRDFIDAVRFLFEGKFAWRLFIIRHPQKSRQRAAGFALLAWTLALGAPYARLTIISPPSREASGARGFSKQPDTGISRTSLTQFVNCLPFLRETSVWSRSIGASSLRLLG